MVTLGWPR